MIRCPICLTQRPGQNSNSDMQRFHATWDQFSLPSNVRVGEGCYPEDRG